MTPQPTAPSQDPVDDYLTRMAQTIKHISRSQIWTVIDALYQAWRTGKQIFIFGNGGSAATASHMTNDLNKFASLGDKRRFKAFCLSDNVPLITAWANDSHYEDIFAEQLLNFLAPGDIVIAISTSGDSANVLRALETARAGGAQIIGFTGKDGGQMKDLVDHCIFIPDDHMGRQEDGHLIIDHIICNTLREMIVTGSGQSRTARK